MKTAKFSDVVKQCGEPAIYLTWVDPARDKTLKRALAEHRVMTLHQVLHGGKKDFGSVGLLKDRRAQLLVFPKSLRKFADRKVIAIDYALIARDQLISGGGLPKKQENRPPIAKRPAERHEETVPDVATQNAASGPAASPVKKTAPLPPKKAWTPEEILAQVKRAVGELAVGKSVPAYERLKRLLDSTRT